MLGKLFKHELLDLFRKIVLFYLAVIAISFLLFLLGLFEHTIIRYINSLFSIGYIIALFGLIFYSVFYPIKRFYKSMYKDEGYLTNTLPISTAHIIFTKLTCALILFLCSVFVVILSLLLNDINVFVLLKFINGTRGNIFVTYLIVFMYLIIYFYQVIMLFITSFAVGESCSVGKTKYSILTGFGIYMVQQFIGAAVIGIFFSEINSEQLSEYIIMKILLIPSLFGLILVVIEIYITYIISKKKLNLL